MTKTIHKINQILFIHLFLYNNDMKNNMIAIMPCIISISAEYLAYVYDSNNLIL